MEQILDIFKISFAKGQAAELLGKTSRGENVELYKFRLSWSPENAEANDTFTFEWYYPIVDDLYRWTPTCGERRYLFPNWCGYETSTLSMGAPICSHYNGAGRNRYTWSVDECAKTVRYKSGVREEDGTLENKLQVDVRQFTNQFETELTLYFDTRDVALHQTISDIAAWWTDDLGIRPIVPPDTAYDPVYSFWYSYHQMISDKSVEEECRRAKALGFDICIVDDGWQTDDTGRGYAYCGDWEPTKNKFPDMKAHVKAVHDIGMKYVLWFSVPLMGIHAKRYEEFKDMFLRWYDYGNHGVLDPRYKKVREFLLSVYKNALTEWDLDGLKLDFIDEWRPDDRNAPYSPEMDIPVLSDAVDVFMTQLITALREIRPDVLIEFRQNYIGPNMRKYGNMFRVSDCPYDYTKNRVGICDLRMLMPGSAVHSDMLMWRGDMPAHLAAVQIIHVMFGVLQYSARLDQISAEQQVMSKFWLRFLKEHKDLLLNGEFTPYDPHMLYSWAKSTKGNACAVGVFLSGKCVKPDAADTIYIANGGSCDQVLVDLCGSYDVNMFDCFGTMGAASRTSFDGVKALNIPVGGLAVLTKVR